MKFKLGLKAVAVSVVALVCFTLGSGVALGMNQNKDQVMTEVEEANRSNDEMIAKLDEIIKGHVEVGRIREMYIHRRHWIDWLRGEWHDFHFEGQEKIGYLSANEILRSCGLGLDATIGYLVEQGVAGDLRDCFAQANASWDRLPTPEQIQRRERQRAYDINPEKERQEAQARERQAREREEKERQERQARERRLVEEIERERQARERLEKEKQEIQAREERERQERERLEGEKREAQTRERQAREELERERKGRSESHKRHEARERQLREEKERQEQELRQKQREIERREQDKRERCESRERERRERERQLRQLIEEKERARQERERLEANERHIRVFVDSLVNQLMSMSDFGSALECYMEQDEVTKCKVNAILLSGDKQMVEFAHKIIGGGCENEEAVDDAIRSGGSEASRVITDIIGNKHKKK
jgi:myosin heavy subunit